jgi:hypothetical protein
LMLEAVPSRVKQPVREPYHSPPPSVEVKNCGATSPLSIRLHGVMLNSLSTEQLYLALFAKSFI